MSSMSQKELMEYDSILFEKRHGRKLDWSNLRTYSEKMQWEKLFDKDPLKATLSDKYLVRDWVAKKDWRELLNTAYWGLGQCG